MNIEERVLAMKNLITAAAVSCGLNLTVFDGKIAFVDQKAKKIVAVWAPEYTVDDIPEKKEKYAE